jgi:hypothetical protein
VKLRKLGVHHDDAIVGEGEHDVRALALEHINPAAGIARGDLYLVEGRGT